MMDARITYVLHPGVVISRHDGDAHYIGALKLSQLYGVELRDCVVHPPNSRGMRGFPDEGTDEYGYPSAWVHLWPQTNGDHTLPEVTP